MICENQVFVVTSRFSNETFNENETYRQRNNLQGCIYGSPLTISKKIPTEASVFVVEMNNNTNKILGIGKIVNYPNRNRPPPVYSYGNYNRYLYTGTKRMDRDEIERFSPALVETLETLLFKGKTHAKRGSGLITYPETLIQKHTPTTPSDKNNAKVNINVKKEIFNIFHLRFSEPVGNQPNQTEHT